jgi:hypothetical protein
MKSEVVTKERETPPAVPTARHTGTAPCLRAASDAGDALATMGELLASVCRNRLALAIPCSASALVFPRAYPKQQRITLTGVFDRLFQDSRLHQLNGFNI